MSGNSYELAKIRKQLHATQSQMARYMGVALRTYEDLEAGRTKVRPVHINAAYWASIHFVSENHPTQAIEFLDAEVVDIMRMATGK